MKTPPCFEGLLECTPILFHFIILLLSIEELETSDKIGRIHAKTNKDGWLYIKGLPYDTCFIFAIDDGK